ncbi:MAG: RES family NAD+ phosphorylase [Ahrensia sp.]
MDIWRISNHSDLSGRGGLLAAQRWNHQGDPIVYCCEHPALSMLEILVNADLNLLPTNYQLLRVHVPEHVSRAEAKLADGWRDDAIMTQDYWRAFCAQSSACLLKVPSVVMPYAWNWLINPRHADHAHLAVTEQVRYPFDSRFAA